MIVTPEVVLRCLSEYQRIYEKWYLNPCIRSYKPLIIAFRCRTALADFLINITTSNPSLIVTRPTPFSFNGLNSLCAIYPGVAPPSTSLTCRTDISPGRFVVVLVPFATRQLALCEVAVFANLTYSKFFS